MPFKIKNGFPSNLACHSFLRAGWFCPLQPRMGWTPSTVTALLACLPPGVQAPPPSLYGLLPVCCSPRTLWPPCHPPFPDSASLSHAQP